MLARLLLALAPMLQDELPPARFELLEGRAQVASAAGVSQASGPERPLEIVGSAYVELHVRARARVDWPGAASLEIFGPATLEWGPIASRPGELRLRLFTCDKLFFETRRAPLQIDFTGGWRHDLERGAGCVMARQGGAFELFLIAGNPGFLSAQTSERIVWPERTLLPGARVLLVPGQREPLPRAGSERRVLDLHSRDEREAWERERPAQAWKSRAWPWKPHASSAS
jgi:hypothetical protein